MDDNSKTHFAQFITALCMYYCNHGTMNYGNYLFLHEFVNDKKEFPNTSFQTSLGPNMEHMELKPQDTKKLIETFRDMLNLTYFESIQRIWIYNGKALNDRAIVNSYTLIADYLDDREKGELATFVDKHDWFKILYILRNMASHGWKIIGKKGLQFPDDNRNGIKNAKRFSDVLTFHTITLTRGQKMPPIINEVQVSKLLQKSISVFLKDPIFNPNT